MGSDPALSVVDDGLRLHEASNVVALGAGCFPTSSASNPTLTLSALALRAGRML
jgi:choline dehydrogenase-like flavoprotein